MAGEGFSLELAARVLAEDPLDLAGPWAELEAARILRVDIEFEPQGHVGYPIPHYDIHAYFVSHQEHLGYCP